MSCISALTTCTTNSCIELFWVVNPVATLPDVDTGIVDAEVADVLLEVEIDPAAAGCWVELDVAVGTVEAVCVVWDPSIA